MPITTMRNLGWNEPEDNKIRTRRKLAGDNSVPFISYHDGILDGITTNHSGEKDEGMGVCNEDGVLQDCDVDNDDFGEFSEDDDNIDVIPFEIRQEQQEQLINDIFTSEVFKTMQQYKETKRQDALKSTEIAKRVSQWHDSIMPVLDAAECRSKFDVQDYGTRILAKFPDNDTVTFRPFSEIVGDQCKEEICRYFLSSLMLANTYNIEIRNSKPGELNKDCLEMKLITKVRHHDALDNNLRAASQGTED